MPDFKIIRKPKYIDSLFYTLKSELTQQNIVLINKKNIGNIDFTKGSGIVPAIICTDKETKLKKGQNVSISCFYKNIGIRFRSKIKSFDSNKYKITKPAKIIITQQRRSERYTFDTSKYIQVFLPFINEHLPIIDIGYRGIGVIAKKKYITKRKVINDCIIKTPQATFRVNCKFRNCVKVSNNKWKYGIEIDFPDRQLYFQYLEWVYHLLNPDIFTSSYLSGADLKNLYDNTRSVLISKDLSRKKALYEELSLWDNNKKIITHQCNIALVKNNKLISACTAKRIYNNTLYVQRLICIPGMHLHDSPKISLYLALSDILYHHPNCDYLILQKDRDIEWHERVFQELVNYSKDEENVSFEKLSYVTISIDSDYLNNKRPSNSSLSCTPLTTYDDFISLVKHFHNNLTINSHCYTTNHDISRISESKNIEDNSMKRMVFKIESKDRNVGLAVCELYREGYISGNSLDKCTLYFISEELNKFEVINEIKNEITHFYNKNKKSTFRIAWKASKDQLKNAKINGEIYRGEFLQLILSKKGLQYFNHVLKIFSKQFAKYYHLTYPQQSIWYYEKLLPHTSVNNITCTIKLNERVNFKLLESAINQVVKFYDPIRIQITLKHGHIYQYVTSFKEAKISFNDFINKKIILFNKFEKELTKEPFKLLNSNLFQFNMFRISEFNNGYIIKMHHIISDAWTITTITNKIKEVYNNLVKSIPIEHSGNYSYIAYVNKDFKYRFSKRFEKDKQFWFEIYNSVPEDILFKKKNLKLQKGISKRQTFTFNKELSIKIKNFSKKSSSSPFSFFMSCIYVYIYKIFNISDIVIGTAVLNRSGNYEKNTPGLFISSIPVRILVEKVMTFSQLLQRVTTTFSKLLKHQKFPYELLAQHIRQNNSEFKNLYAITFTYQNVKVEDNYSLVWHPYHYQRDHLNIHVHDREYRDVFSIDYDYLIETFSRDEINRMHSLLLNIITYVLDNYDKSIKTVSILTKNEINRILYTFNNTSMSYPKDKSIHTLFEKQVVKNPGNIAIIDSNKYYTNSKVNKYSNKIARLLYSINKNETGKFVGIFINNSFNQVIAQMGVLKSGNAYIPIESSTPKIRLKSIIDDANITTIITISKNSDLVSSLQWECKSLRNILFLDTSCIYAPENIGSNPLMSLDLWRHVGKNSEDFITAGGWINSYTGKPFTVEEMKEYSNNAVKKIKPYLNASSNVLEIGCASGITMYKLAPSVNLYHGTDMSDIIIEKNHKYIKKENISNIKLSVLAAHEIKTLNKYKYDVIIINSVIQAFPGYNYLRNVITDAIKLLSKKGILFIGDIMDLDSKEDLINSLKQYKNKHPRKSVKTKTDFFNELFVPREYFDNVKNSINDVMRIDYSKKYYTIKNELTEFRYDVIIHINKCSKYTTPKTDFIKQQFGFDEISSNKESNLNLPISSTELAYVIYTSGTTAKPKGVMIEHKSVVNLCWWYKKYYKISSSDIVARYIPFSFDPSVAETFSSLISGSTIHIIPEPIRNDPDNLNRYLNENKVTVCSIPSQFYDLFKKYINISLRLLIVGGDKFIAYKKNNYNVVNNYGPTENTVVTTVFPIKKALKNYPIGKPIANNQIYILDVNNNLSPIGIPGELCISGDSLARGYINTTLNSGFVKNPFSPNRKMYKTGDLARWLPDGNIEFIGRIDEQIKLRGFRIELKEIESILLQYESVQSAAVIVKKSSKEDKYLIAFYKATREIKKKELVNFLSERLPSYMIPSLFIHLSSLPLLISGKIDKKALLFYKFSSNKRNPIKVLLKDEIDKKLFNILSNYLLCNNIKPGASFYEMGGDSLKAIEISNKIEAEFNIKLPIKFLLGNPTFEEITIFTKKQQSTKTKAINKTSQADSYLATPGQQRLYFLYLEDPESISYNMPGAFITSNNIDIIKLKNAVHELITRHEILRTAFVYRKSELVQEIKLKVNFNVEYIETNEKNIETEIASFIKPFDLSKPPLIRCKILHFNSGEYALLIDIHHIVSDGRSTEILLQELSTLYEGNPLSPQSLQFKDYSSWFNKQLSIEKLKKQDDFWQKSLEGELPVLNFPTDYKRIENQAIKGNRTFFKINKDITRKLIKIGNDNNATLFMTLLSCHFILLSKYTDQSDIIIGTVTSGRQRAEFQKIVGFFVNTIPIRCPINTNDTFITFLNKVKSIVKDVLKNQDYPFSEIIKKVNVQREEKRNPLFDIMFILQNTDLNNFSIGSINFKQYKYKNKSCKFDLTFQCTPKDGNLCFELEYCTNLFKKETVKRIINHFKNTTKSIASNPNIKILDIQLVNYQEKYKLLKTFNNTEFRYPKMNSILDLFNNQVIKFPNKTVAIYEKKCITYNDLNKKSNAIASEILNYSKGSSEIIGIYTERSIEMLIGILGILKAGAAYLPISPQYPELHKQYIINDSRIKILLIQDKFRNKLKFPGEIININSTKSKRKNRSIQPSSHDLAYVIYTSGSTGKPKGVMIEHGTLLNRLNWMQKEFPIGIKDTILQKTPYTFDVSVWELLWGIIQGSSVCFLKHNEEMIPTTIIKTIELNKVTIIHFVPSLLNVFLDYLDSNNCVNQLRSLRFIIASGEKLSKKVVKKFYKTLKSIKHVKLYNLYGPTEATIDVTYFDCSKERKYDSIPIGKPIDNTKMFILGKDCKYLLPIGVIGELCISGHCLARGYLNKTELTKEKFINNPVELDTRIYRTGDLARWLPDGNIEYIGRSDDQVKINGNRIELGEIENCLTLHPLISQSVVIVKNFSSDQKRIVAYLVTKKKIVHQEIRNYTKQRLPDYMVPSYFIPIDNLPLTSHGKVDRKTLSDPKDYQDKNEIIKKPRNKTEKQLVTIWQKLLGIINIDTSRNFFDIGGNSLQIITLVNEIENQFQCTIPVQILIKNNTVQLQARVIDQNKQTKSKKTTSKELQNFLKAVSQNTIQIKSQSLLPKSTEKRVSFSTSLFHEAYAKPNKVVFVNNVIPSELLFAFDLIPFNVEMVSALLANSSMAPKFINSAEKRNFSNDICSFTRCTLGAAFEECLPKPSLIISSSYPCDSSSRLFYQLSKLYKKKLLLLDIPYNHNTHSSLYLEHQLKQLVKHIEEHLNIKLNKEKLEVSTHRSNSALKSLMKLNSLCEKSPCPVSVSDAMEIFTNFHHFGSPELVDIFESYYDEAYVVSKFNKTSNTKRRIVWLGMRPYFNNEIFTYLEKDCNLEIISCYSLTDFLPIYWEKINYADPIAGLAKKIKKMSGAGPIDNYVSDKNVHAINNYAIDGVISFSQWGCRHMLGIHQLLREIVTSGHIPFLEIDSDYIDNRNYSFEQIKTRIDAFIEVIHNKERKTA